MFGLDEWIASRSDGTSLLIVSVVAVLLGLRHATDPDHLAAMSTLIASGRERAARAGARLGFAWGLGHGTTLFVFGLPIVVLDKYLPERALQFAETLIAIVIVYLAVRLLVRWRRGHLHVHEHDHGGRPHSHLHSHARETTHGHPHPRPERSALGAYGIGLVHGMGGSAGVGILIVASVASTALSVLALVLLAAFTAASMTIVTGGFGLTIGSRPVRSAFSKVAPALGGASLAFGIWYGSAAWALAPYPF
jgi:ABC-type nickel/cobalt efflux system permease component RcnA